MDRSERSVSVDSFLEHYGVKGMKWGVRKEPDVVLRKTLKDGGELKVTKDPPPAIAKFLSKLSPSYKASVDKGAFFTLTDKEGKKVGDASFRQDSPDSLNLSWIGVKSKHRGKGYASAALEGVVKYAQDKGLKRLTLEVPGDSPDARHIYTKLGFKDKPNQKVEIDPYWGGLTEMELIVPQTKVKHFDIDEMEIFEYIERELNAMPVEVDEFLKHYGVLGMKWGRRRSDAQLATARKTRVRSRDAQKVQTLKKKAKKAGRDSLSNDELQTVIRRRELEKRYSDLNPSVMKRGLSVVKEVSNTANLALNVTSIGKRVRDINK